MAYSRLFLTAFLGLTLSLLGPVFGASAQDVHEVRPAASDEIIIGTHGTAATFGQILALAQRITGNTALTMEDILVNDDRPRYVCRVHGRQIYFGRDPDFGGARCPEDAERTRGVLSPHAYRVPRVHGAVLTRHASRDTRHATPPTVIVTEVPDPAATARVAELETVVSELVVDRDTAIAERNEARGEASATAVELETVQIELDTANAIIARLTAERDAVIAERDQARHEGDVMFWIACGVLASLALIIAFMVIGFILQRRAQAGLSGQLRTLDRDHRSLKELHRDRGKRLELFERYRRLIRYGSARAKEASTRLTEQLAELKPRLSKAEEMNGLWERRRDRICEYNLELIGLRVQEDMYDNLVLLKQAAMDYAREAQSLGDETQAINHVTAAAVYEDELKRLAFDPQDIKSQIAERTQLMCLEMKDQTGIAFDGRASDEWKADWVTRARKKEMEAEAKRRLHDDLLTELRKAMMAKHAEWREKELALEEKAGALEERVMEHGLVKQQLSDALARLRLVSEVEEQLRDALKKIGELEALVKEHRLREQMLIEGENSESAAHLMMMYDARLEESRRKIEKYEAELTVLRINNTHTAPHSSPEEPAPLEEQEASAEAAPITGRPRRETGAMGPAMPGQGARLSVPGTPFRKEVVLLTELIKYLELFSDDAPSSERVLRLNEFEGRDLLYWLSTYSVVCPAILKGKPVPLHMYPATVEKLDPKLLKSRLRRKTDPPPAPVPA